MGYHGRTPPWQSTPELFTAAYSMTRPDVFLSSAVKKGLGNNRIVNFNPTLAGRHDAMFEIASLSFDGVSGLRLAVAGLDNVQVTARIMSTCFTAIAHHRQSRPGTALFVPCQLFEKSMLF